VPDQPVQLLQGTLDMIVLQALSSMGPLHAYALAARLEQVAGEPFPLNQGTLGPRALDDETARWRRLAALIDKLLVSSSS
jgi:PadR family transcriptional regulator PadR